MNHHPLVETVRSAHGWLVTLGAALQPLFLLVVRLYWGWQCFVSGHAHLSDVPAMASRFAQWGVPFPTFNVYLSGGTEMICGLFLLAGLASRFIAIPLIVNFCVAYLTASRATLLNIFHDPDSFVSDAAFLFLYAAVIIFLFGPGPFSLDALIARRFGRVRCEPAQDFAAQPRSSEPR